MKRGIIILLCLLFSSCSNYLRKEEIKDINHCLVKFQKSIRPTEIYYHTSPSYKLLTNGNYEISKAQIIESNGKVIGLQSDFVYFNGLGSIIGNYLFNMDIWEGKTIIYITFRDKNKWYMIKYISN